MATSSRPHQPRRPQSGNFWLCGNALFWLLCLIWPKANSHFCPIIVDHYFDFPLMTGCNHFYLPQYPSSCLLDILVILISSNLMTAINMTISPDFANQLPATVWFTVFLYLLLLVSLNGRMCRLSLLFSSLVTRNVSSAFQHPHRLERIKHFLQIFALQIQTIH